MTFARYWRGSIRETVDAMNKDGVKMAYRTCQRYIADPEVQAAIRIHTNAENRAGVSERDEILIMWGKVMRDESRPTMYRLRASELLAKALGMFLEKKPEPAALTFADLTRRGYNDD